jgi:hypothetical protein
VRCAIIESATTRRDRELSMKKLLILLAAAGLAAGLLYLRRSRRRTEDGEFWRVA